MPALRSCGCNWCVGSDDFVYSGVLALLIRIGWFIASAVILDIHVDTQQSQPSGSPTCHARGHATVFVCGLMFDLVVQSVLKLVLICRSGRGRMNDARRDEDISKLTALQLFLFVIEVCWLLLGTIWMFSNDSSCYPTANKIKSLLITGYVWICLYLLHIVCSLDPAGCCRSPALRADPECQLDEGTYRASQRSWEKCCRVVCCLADVGNANRGVLLDVARLFATVFDKTGISGNMVATDFAASMALVQLRQEQEEHEHNKLNDIAAGDRPYAGKLGALDHPCLPIDFNDSNQQSRTQAVVDSRYYMKYALAAYGWPLLMLMRIGTGLCRLAPNCRCCTCCRTHSTPSDHCLECNTSAILHQTGLSRDDIIHVTYHNKAYRPPYFVTIDRTKRVIIISIRGTMSISDALTDLTAEAVSFEHTSGTLHAHEGIFRAAKYIKTQLEQQDNSEEPCILDRAFEYAKEVDPGGEYKLVITGHSLGAGTASILSLLYVLETRYPGLVCFAYSPPGGLLSLPAVEITKEFTTTVVLGKDLIPRLSLDKAYQLVDIMKDEAQRSSSPKWLIQMRCFCACCWRRCRCDGVIPREEEGAMSLGADANGNSYCRTSTAESRSGGPLLYPPGNIIYIVKFPKGKKCYQAYWTDYREFHTVFVGGAMVGDHLPNHVHDALQNLHSGKDL